MQIEATQGRRGLAQICAVPHSAGPASNPRRWRHVRPERSRSDLRGASLRWTHQQSSKVATVSQTAATQGGRGLAQICAVPYSAGHTSIPRKRRQLRISQPPRDGEVSLRSARCLAPLDPPAAFERSGSAGRSHPGTERSRSTDHVFNRLNVQGSTQYSTDPVYKKAPNTQLTASPRQHSVLNRPSCQRPPQRGQFKHPIRPPAPCPPLSRPPVPPPASVTKRAPNTQQTPSPREHPVLNKLRVQESTQYSTSCVSETDSTQYSTDPLPRNTY